MVEDLSHAIRRPKGFRGISSRGSGTPELKRVGSVLYLYSSDIFGIGQLARRLRIVNPECYGYIRIRRLAVRVG